MILMLVISLTEIIWEKGMRGKKWGQARQDHFAEKTREILGEEFSNRYKVQRGERF